MTILRIYFSARWRDSASECPWALCDDSGAVLQSGAGPLASMPKAGECIAIIAAARTLCSSITAPAGPRRRWLRALPLLAEEHTLPDPEENHVAPGAMLDNNQLALVVTDKSWLRQIIDSCRAANLPLRKAVPEIALPAVAQDSWTLVWNGANGFVCTGAGKGAELDTADAHTPPVALQLLLEGAAPRRIELRFPHDAPPEQKTLPQWQNMTPEFSRGADWDWRSAAIPADAPNLLWGEFAPPARPLEWWPKFRPAAMLLLAVLGVEMVGSNLQWAMLAWEKKSLTRSMEQSFRQAFGNEANLVNAPLQMQRNLSDLRHGAGAQDDGDFLSLLKMASGALAGLPAGALREMHYAGSQLTLEIKLESASEASAMKRKLLDLGLDANADIKDTGKGVDVRLTLQQGNAT